MSTLTTRIGDLATRIATEVKAVRTLVNGNAADLSGLSTTAKSNLVAACNELYALASAAAPISDSASDTTHTWSASKIAAAIATAKSDLVNGAGSALDTLAELATALGNDPNYATTITTALGKRVRADAAQSFTAGEKTQALANIGAQDSASIGTPDTDFVAIFNTGLI